MNFAWHRLRHLIAVTMAQSIILSQACALGIGTQPAGDQTRQLTDSTAQSLAHSTTQTENRDIIAMMPPPRRHGFPINRSSDGTTSDTDGTGEEQTDGLKFKISPGKPAQDNEELTPVAPAEILSEAETNKLLKLLPPLVQEKAREFVLPARSLPPPNKQNRINEPFPPHDQKAAPAAPTSSPLSITSKRPVGNIDHASAISVTFSQPMVPITTQSSLETKTPPVSIKPALDGQWKWFGTQTLTFEPTAKQLPMSTFYEMNVPAGTASVTGGKLATGETWNFSTSTVQLISSYPDISPSVKPTTLIMARFNQKIDKEAILAMTKISTREQFFPVVSASQAEIDSDKVLKSRLKDVPENTFVVFKASAPLPLASTIAVKIGPQIKSAEGPLLSKKSADFQFLTYGVFKVLPQAAYEKSVLPDDPMSVRFSNGIDKKSVNTSTITISPPIADVKIECYQDTITISGTKKPNTTYQVQLSGQITDVFGQKLVGGTQTLKFNVKHVDKQLYMPDDLMVLPSESKPKFALTSVNLTSLEMRIYSVAPEEYSKFQQDRYEFVKHHKPAHIGPLKIKNVEDHVVVTNVDLGRWLDNNRGSIVISFKSHEIPYDNDNEHMCWVQCTNIGLDAFVDAQSIQAWVTDLVTGVPVKGAKVSFAPGGDAYQTDANGLVTVPLTDKSYERVLVARSGKDAAIVGRPYTFSRQENSTNYLWYVVTDRSPYRPGEKINAKGILRQRLNKPTADLSLPQVFKSISYSFVDSLGNEIGKGKTDINQFGGFDLSFTLPTNVNLGNVELNLIGESREVNKPSLATHNLWISVAEFRRPEFELKVNNEGPSVQIVKGATTLSATTNYFAGGSLANADINWTATSTSTTYSPPGWSEFLFGKAPFPYFDYLFPVPFNRAKTRQQHLKSTTDSSGKNYLHIDYLDVHPSEPSNITVSATVQDVNRQTWTDTTTLLVHPSELYVGTKLEKSFVKKETSLPMSAVVTDVDGKAMENVQVKIELYRASAEDVGGNPVEKKDDVQVLSITSGAKPVQISLQPKLGGLYKVVSSVTDSSGRRNETINKFWCEGGTARAEANPDAHFNLQKLILLPEKSEYKPGDKATVLVQSPFFPAEGLATIWHNGLSTTVPFHMNESSYDLEISIADHDIPEIGVQVDLLGIDKQDTKTKNAPAEAAGSVNITVSNEDRKLNVDAKPDVASSAPGKEVSINIDVTDHTGARVANAEIAVAVVDDALLSLVNYKFSDPLQTFYPPVGTGAEVLRERESLDMTAFLKEPVAKSLRNKNYPTALPPPPMPGGAGAMAAPAASPAFGAANEVARAVGGQGQDYSNAGTQFQVLSRGHYNKAKNAMAPKPVAGMAESEPGQGPQSVQLRSNFDALAKWAPSVVTDEKGHAEVKFKLPDNLTRYRIMAVASHASNEFGSGDASLTVRLPLMVKPSAPRFLNYGDQFELPVVLRNQTDTPIDVNLAARAANAEFTHGQGRHTTIPANDRVEIRLPASTVKSGTARFQVIAVAGTNSDAAEFSLPVYTPATTEAFATYGQIENGAIAQSIETPKDVIPDFGSLELTTSTTVLETLTDAFIYLQHYPFECSEQISSRLISISLMKDMLKEFHAEGLPGEQEIKKTVSDDLQKLQSRQQPNGSFALWRSTERITYPYVTLNVAQALILAKKAGYDVNARMLEKTMQYLKNIDKYIDDYKGNARIDLKAMALYLRDKNGDTDISAAHALLSAQPLDKLSLEAMGFLLQIFAHKDPTSKDATAIYTYLSNCIVETASTAEIVRNGNSAAITCSDYRLFDSPSRVKAILLDSLLAEGKSPEIVTKLMRSLLGGQIKGRWRNTQENAYVLLAMRHYFDKYEKTVPDLLAEAWLGKAFIGESAFKGRTNDFKTITVPMTYLSEMANTKEFILKKTGNGRLYYRLGLNYAPKSLHLSSMDRGFKVTRTYEGVTNKDDVKKDSNGIWQFKPGSLIKVKLNITASSERFFVAVVDPLPAGAEALNQDLNGTESVTSKDSPNSSSDESSSSWRWGWRWWTMNWWNHENKRDNQTEVFADQLWGGSHDYSYLMRATTPGTYVVPPTKAEEMYAPETFGRTASETVIIK